MPFFKPTSVQIRLLVISLGEGVATACVGARVCVATVPVFRH